MHNKSFERTEILLGSKIMKALSEVKVILFGVGGVGSWCAESLIRSGIQYLTLVDMDKIDVSNINRQLMATTNTIDQIKVEVLKERLLAINPEAEITIYHTRYTAESSEVYNLDSFDYILDAIDSMDDKMDLLVRAVNTTTSVVFSSMGAAFKLNPSYIKTAEFWKVTGCPLAASLRRRFRKNKINLSKKVLCVYSDEKLALPKDINPLLIEEKQRINGTLAHITAIFGFTLAGLLVQDVVAKRK